MSRIVRVTIECHESHALQTPLDEDDYRQEIDDVLPYGYNVVSVEIEED